MTVEPVGGVEGKKRCHADDDRPERFVPNIEVIMGETAGLMRQDAVVGILLDPAWDTLACRSETCGPAPCSLNCLRTNPMTQCSIR